MIDKNFNDFFSEVSQKKVCYLKESFFEDNFENHSKESPAAFSLTGSRI
jgi:hypothetical protein